MARERRNSSISWLLMGRAGVEGSGGGMGTSVHLQTTQLSSE